MLRLVCVLAAAVWGLSAAHSKVNKHKPWIETSYHGVITENTDVVLLDPPLVALDKDAPVPYAVNLFSNPLGLQSGVRQSPQLLVWNNRKVAELCVKAGYD